MARRGRHSHQPQKPFPKHTYARSARERSSYARTPHMFKGQTGGTLLFHNLILRLLRTFQMLKGRTGGTLLRDAAWPPGAGAVCINALNAGRPRWPRDMAGSGPRAPRRAGVRCSPRRLMRSRDCGMICMHFPSLRLAVSPCHQAARRRAHRAASGSAARDAWRGMPVPARLSVHRRRGRSHPPGWGMS
jgi:hypothetical protein